MCKKIDEDRKPQWVDASSTDPFERMTTAERDAIGLVRLMVATNEPGSTAYHTLLSAGEHVASACLIVERLDAEARKE